MTHDPISLIFVPVMCAVSSLKGAAIVGPVFSERGLAGRPLSLATLATLRLSVSGSFLALGESLVELEPPLRVLLILAARGAAESCAVRRNVCSIN